MFIRTDLSYTHTFFLIKDNKICVRFKSVEESALLLRDNYEETRFGVVLLGEREREWFLLLAREVALMTGISTHSTDNKNPSGGVRITANYAKTRHEQKRQIKSKFIERPKARAARERRARLENGIRHKERR